MTGLRTVWTIGIAINRLIRLECERRCEELDFELTFRKTKDNLSYVESGQGVFGPETLTGCGSMLRNDREVTQDPDRSPLVRTSHPRTVRLGHDRDRHGLIWSWLLACVVLSGAAASLGAAPPAKALLHLHQEEARAIPLFADMEQKQPLQFDPQPIFTWTNLLRDRVQSGHLFVWLKDGRPEVVATVFSTPEVSNPDGKNPPPPRMLIHEFHTLSASRLYPGQPPGARYRWEPLKGIQRQPLPNAPAVPATAPARLIAMRDIARRFQGETFDSRHDNERWELRLLPRPAYRYLPQKSGVMDGALFLYVSSAGTDPEFILLVEAVQADASKEYEWQTAVLRFTDRDLVVRDGQQTVFSSLNDPARKVSINSDFTLVRNPDQTYTCYMAKLIPELPDAPAAEAPSGAKKMSDQFDSGKLPASKKADAEAVKKE